MTAPTLEKLIAIWQAASPERRAAMIEAGQGNPEAPASGPALTRALTYPKAADAAGYSVMTLRRAVEKGELREVRPFGKSKPRISEADLARWMEGKGKQ